MPYYEDIIVTEDGRTLCELCEIYISTDDMIESHLDCEKHVSLYISRLMIQNNINAEVNKAYCLICKVDLVDLMVHIQSSQHQRLMNEINEVIEKDRSFLVLPQNLNTNGSQVYCTICNNFMIFTLESIKDHVHSLKHKRARSMAVQPFNGIFSVEEHDDYLWCKVCQIYFENYIETIFEHVDDNKEHKTRLTKILRLIEGQNITIDKYLTQANEHSATCLKCNTVVACNVDNLERHITGKRHKGH